jgi:hypothetical protein
MVLITAGVMTALALVLGFALADLNKVAQEHRDDTDRSRSRRERAFAAIPQRPEAQVEVLKHYFAESPEVAVRRLPEFPQESVIKALVSLHGSSRDAERRMLYLKLLSEQKHAAGAAYLERVAASGAGPESAVARDLLSRRR